MNKFFGIVLVLLICQTGYSNSSKIVEKFKGDINYSKDFFAGSKI